MVANLFFASFWLKEAITRLDVFATFLIIGGVVLTAAFADKSAQCFTLETLLRLYTRTEFIVYAVVVVATIVSLYALLRHVRTLRKKGEDTVEYLRYIKIHPILCGSLSALLGAQSVLFAKSTIELFKVSVAGDNQFTFIGSWLIVFAMLFSIFGQIHFLAMGLKHFDAALIVPIFQSLYTVGAIVSGAAYFDEFKDFNTLQTIFFPIGVCIIVGGVQLLTLRQKRSRAMEGSSDASSEHGVGSSAERSSGARTPIMLMNGDGGDGGPISTGGTGGGGSGRAGGSGLTKGTRRKFSNIGEDDEQAIPPMGPDDAVPGDSDGEDYYSDDLLALEDKRPGHASHGPLQRAHSSPHHKNPRSMASAPFLRARSSDEVTTGRPSTPSTEPPPLPTRAVVEEPSEHRERRSQPHPHPHPIATSSHRRGSKESIDVERAREFGGVTGRYVPMLMLWNELPEIPDLGAPSVPRVFSPLASATHRGSGLSSWTRKRRASMPNFDTGAAADLGTDVDNGAGESAAGANASERGEADGEGGGGGGGGGGSARLLNHLRLPHFLHLDRSSPTHKNGSDLSKSSFSGGDGDATTQRPPKEQPTHTPSRSFLADAGRNASGLGRAIRDKVGSGLKSDGSPWRTVDSEEDELVKEDMGAEHLDLERGISSSSQSSPGRRRSHTWASPHQTLFDQAAVPNLAVHGEMDIEGSPEEPFTLGPRGDVHKADDGHGSDDDDDDLDSDEDRGKKAPPVGSVSP